MIWPTKLAISLTGTGPLQSRRKVAQANAFLILASGIEIVNIKQFSTALSHCISCKGTHKHLSAFGIKPDAKRLHLICFERRWSCDDATNETKKNMKYLEKSVQECVTPWGEGARRGRGGGGHNATKAAKENNKRI